MREDMKTLEAFRSAQVPVFPQSALKNFRIEEHEYKKVLPAMKNCEDLKAGLISVSALELGAERKARSSSQTASSEITVSIQIQ